MAPGYHRQEKRDNGQSRCAQQAVEGQTSDSVRISILDDARLRSSGARILTYAAPAPPASLLPAPRVGWDKDRLP
ncbi:hypothetical protein MKX07_008684 [Trichoderma sp. CBMAI-0711]|nr:hypothetical protein MKX07_008684 [Trichoderma sp. CBMAI-0711]